MLKIANILLTRVKRTVKANSKITIKYDQSLAQYVVDNCRDVSQYGARPMKRTITELLETPLADYIIDNIDVAKKIQISVDSTGVVFSSDSSC